MAFNKCEDKFNSGINTKCLKCHKDEFTVLLEILRDEPVTQSLTGTWPTEDDNLAAYEI